MVDYRTLIDAETWAFIERTESHYPPDAVNRSIAEQRTVYDRMCREFFSGYPDGVSATDERIAAAARSIPIRKYRTAHTEPEAMVLYTHGGGFVVGGLDSHDDVCAELCARTGFAVIAVDYRLAPENAHPAAFEDALAAFRWAVAEHRLPVVLCGDSAGGNLVAAVSHATRRDPRPPAGQVLVYPDLGGDITAGSYARHAEAPMLTLPDVLFYRDIRGGDWAADDVTRFALADTDFSHLPATVLVTAECDPLSSDGEAYGSRVVAAGSRAWWHDEPGLVHGYLRARHTVGRARQSFTRIVEAVRALGKGEWPYEEVG